MQSGHFVLCLQPCNAQRTTQVVQRRCQISQRKFATQLNEKPATSTTQKNKNATQFRNADADLEESLVRNARKSGVFQGSATQQSQSPDGSPKRSQRASPWPPIGHQPTQSSVSERSHNAAATQPQRSHNAHRPTLHFKCNMQWRLCNTNPTQLALGSAGTPKSS